MSTYNRRFASIARNRRTRNALGKTNANRRFLFPGFSFSPTTQLRIVRAIASWAILELTEGWRTWFKKQETPQVKKSAAEKFPPNPTRNLNPNPPSPQPIPSPAQSAQ